MALVQVKELLEAGVHYGHHTSRWNPKMSRFIYGKRNSIHIINLIESIRGLLKAYKFLKKLSARGEEILLVGTKRQAASLVGELARKAGVPFVNERWLGGMLTNFQTIRLRLTRLLELEELEETGKLNRYSKKEASMLMREKRKIKRNLDGVRDLNRLPGALVIIDPKKEKIGVLEANKLGIPVIALIDTDCDPDRVNLAIPGNDDAIKSIHLHITKLLQAVEEGKEIARGRVAEIKRLEEEKAEKAAAEKAKLASKPSDAGSDKISEKSNVTKIESIATEQTEDSSQQTTESTAPSVTKTSPQTSAAKNNEEKAKEDTSNDEKTPADTPNTGDSGVSSQE